MPSINYAIIQPPNPKILKVAIMGAPNAGKSTLLNSLLGETVSNLISLFWVYLSMYDIRLTFD